MTPTEVLRQAVAGAIQAPSSHNSQPWRFRIDGDTLDLFADPDRHLTVLDAERRQQIESCGCALFNARVVVRAMGFTDEVTVSLFEGERHDHLATLRLGAPHITTDADHALLAAIPRRRTNRRDFLHRPVAAEHTDAMVAIAAAEGATLVRLHPDQKRALGDLVDRADRQQYDNPAFREELSRWLTTFGSTRRDGIPFVEKEFGSTLPFAVVRALRSPTLGAEFGKIEEAHIIEAPAVLALGTKSDEPADWLACGQALQAILLHATTLGFSASFMNQVLELPDLRARFHELAPELGYPQMVFRIGVATESVQHPAPRRAIEDVLLGGGR